MNLKNKKNRLFIEDKEGKITYGKVNPIHQKITGKIKLKKKSKTRYIQRNCLG